MTLPADERPGVDVLFMEAEAIEHGRKPFMLCVSFEEFRRLDVEVFARGGRYEIHNGGRAVRTHLGMLIIPDANLTGTQTKWVDGDLGAPAVQGAVSPDRCTHICPNGPRPPCAGPAGHSGPHWSVDKRAAWYSDGTDALKPPWGPCFSGADVERWTQ